MFAGTRTGPLRSLLSKPAQRPSSSPKLKFVYLALRPHSFAYVALDSCVTRFIDCDREESAGNRIFRRESREGAPVDIYAANPSKQDRSSMANSPARR